MTKVFVSHVNADKSLIEAFVDLLEGGVGLQPNQIFVTSLEGQGIPPGQDFKTVIAQELRQTEVVCALISENFYASAFCMCELGATWIQAKTFLPILVPPLTFSDLEAVLQGVQCLRLEVPSDMDTMRDTVSHLAKEKLGTPRWNKRRDEFISRLGEILGKLPKSKIVRQEEFEKAVREKEEYAASYGKLDEEVRRKDEVIQRLSKLKDSKEVGQVVYEGMPEQDRFVELIKAAREAVIGLPLAVRKAMFFWARGENYAPETEDWDSTKKKEEDGFLSQMNYGNFSVREDHPRVQKATKALNSLKTFLSKASSEFVDAYQSKHEELLAIESREFWERHLFR